jgi:hypothetical protein
MKRHLLFAPLAFLFAAPGGAQPKAAPVPSVQSDVPEEIVVRGKRLRDKEIETFVDALTPSRLRGQIARYAEPVCPGAMGLSDQHNKVVSERLRAVAKAAGAPLAKAPCRPNLTVIVTDDKQALAKRIRASFSKNSVTPVATANSASAIVLHLEGETDANGQLVGIREESGDGRSGYGEVEVFTSDRIRPGTSPTFLASVMIVEPSAIAGLTTLQLADHAAMRLLAKADPARLAGGTPQTILTLLETPEGAMAPITLTSWDLAFLKGLYASENRSYANSQRGEIQKSMREELGVPTQPRP